MIKKQKSSDYKIISEITENDKEEIVKILNSDEFYQIFEYLMDKY